MASKKGTGKGKGASKGKGSASKARPTAARSSGSSNKAQGNKGPRQETNPFDVVAPAGSDIKENFDPRAPREKFPDDGFTWPVPEDGGIVPDMDTWFAYQQHLDRKQQIKDLVDGWMDQWTKPKKPKPAGGGDNGKPQPVPPEAPNAPFFITPDTGAYDPLSDDTQVFPLYRFPRGTDPGYKKKIRDQMRDKKRDENNNGTGGL